MSRVGIGKCRTRAPWWSAYVDAMEADATWGGIVELLEALCRLHDVRAVVTPYCDPCPPGRPGRELGTLRQHEGCGSGFRV